MQRPRCSAKWPYRWRLMVCLPRSALMRRSGSWRQGTARPVEPHPLPSTGSLPENDAVSSAMTSPRVIFRPRSTASANASGVTLPSSSARTRLASGCTPSKCATNATALPGFPSAAHRSAKNGAPFWWKHCAYESRPTSSYARATHAPPRNHPGPSPPARAPPEC